MIEMALLFCDSFNHIEDGYETVKWDADYFATYATGVGRQGDWGMYFNGATYHLSKTLPSSLSTIILGAAIKTPGHASYELLQFLDNGTLQIEIRIDTAGTIHVYRYTTLLGSSSVGVFPINAWHYFEAKITFSQTVGSVEIKVDGSQVINLTGIDTCYTSNEFVTTVRIEGNALPTYYDDFYLCDTSGTYNNDFLGDIKISLLYPTSDVENDFTPSAGADHYALVDDPQLAADTDHNESSTIGHKDTYGVTSYSAGGTLIGLQICAACKNTDTGTMNVRTICKSGTILTENEGTSFALSQTMKGAMTVYEREPTDSVAWTAAKINAAEFGLKVQS